MKSEIPKVLHACCDRPMLVWILKALEHAGVDRKVVVIGHGAELVRYSLGTSVEYAEQRERLGTGHAALMALPAFEDFQGSILIVAGDTPLLRGETLRKLVEQQQVSKAKCVMATCHLDDPTGYGRIIRNHGGEVVGIVEHKDCTQEQLETTEINPAVYCFDAETLRTHLPKIKNDNAQAEYYLTDMIKLLASEGESIGTVVSDDPDEFRGVNDKWQLAEAGMVLRDRILQTHAKNGVTIVDPQSTFIGADVEIGPEATIMPFTTITGRTHIGKLANIGPHTYLRDSDIGDQTTVFMSHVNSASIDSASTIGPFANIRPESSLGKGVKIGNFVEVKKSRLADGVSASHLSYLGDATVGPKTNIGAGAITCNYDGYTKSRTVIGAESFVGSNSTLIAPVTLGDQVFIAAGSVISEDVPTGAMAIGRGRQVTKDGWFTAWKKRKTEQKNET